jgi:hypothetical protein
MTQKRRAGELKERSEKRPAHGRRRGKALDVFKTGKLEMTAEVRCVEPRGGQDASSVCNSGEAEVILTPFLTFQNLRKYKEIIIAFRNSAIREH